MAKENKKEVKVLAFEKKIVPSDGYMYETMWNNRGEIRPLTIREKSLRGTISNSLKDSVLNDPMKLSAEIEKANLQTVDCCFLSERFDTLVIRFSLKILGNIGIPSACSNNDFLRKYKEVISSYSEEFKFEELSFRYAYNIACARFLWRNRLGADEIEVRVTDTSDGKSWKFDSTTYKLRYFDELKRSELHDFADRIAKAFMGEKSSLFEVECYSKIGKGQEVYPSEEMVLNKTDKDKSKILYCIDNCAAFHSQKIGNAIRTIDTWYPAFNTKDGVGPIAIEPYGPVTTISKAFRSEKNTNFYALKDAYVWEGSLNKEDDKHFFIAMIIRGGVFGESSKE